MFQEKVEQGEAEHALLHRRHELLRYLEWLEGEYKHLAEADPGSVGAWLDVSAIVSLAVQEARKEVRRRGRATE